MDGLAASLAAISAGFFAIAAVTDPAGRDSCSCSRSRSRCACSASCRSTCGPGKRALAWMGDSGSQLIGFLLAALGLASSYTVASSTRRDAPAAGPRARGADPRHDPRHDRAPARRPADLPGRARPQLAPPRLARRLRDRRRRAARARSRPRSARRASPTRHSATAGWRRSACSSPSPCSSSSAACSPTSTAAPEFRRSFLGYTRRLAEVLIDGALIGASFLAAFLLRFNGLGTLNQRHYFLLSLPAILLRALRRADRARPVLERLALRRARATRCER